MSGATPELSLATAVDADDNADYLTLSLANSLRTVDALFNSVTGHTHGGAHQGAPIGSIPSTAIPDGSITSAKIADGTIVAADIANASVTNAKLASDTARDNLLVNGGFEIWQRGGGSFSANGQYTADRWYIGIALSNATVWQDASSVMLDSANSLKVIYNHVGGGNITINQKLEGPLAYQLRGHVVTFSVWVNCQTAPAAGTFIVWLEDQTAALGPTVNAQAVAGWQRITVTATVPNTSTFVLVRISSGATLTFWIDNATLVLGSVPADYAPLHPADDLARCQRYYELFTARLLAGAGAVANGSPFGQYVPFKVTKAVTPAVTPTGAAYTNGSGIAVFDTNATGVTVYYAVTTGTSQSDMTCSFIVEGNP